MLFRSKTYGKPSAVEKMSGGVEPKTDLVITTPRKTLKCSLKFGGSIQLSSAGVETTAKFLTGVVSNLKKSKSISNKKGIFTIIFNSPCGKKEIQVKVR